MEYHIYSNISLYFLGINESYSRILQHSHYKISNFNLYVRAELKW
ncbi:hypothetical protein S101468_02673 [Acetobacter pasteurianus subsp. pasteurianus]|uniref:Uncharacterized protein n=1 Tax=Acetobacter pasteurianus subsp. pasteurianus TaxID=481145 RepID=A0AAC9SSC9_ACEPA|nr:hypothetical protein S101468_02673 [Acetobacter pasteurianus subsp. pasteurianus]